MLYCGIKLLIYTEACQRTQMHDYRTQSFQYGLNLKIVHLYPSFHMLLFYQKSSKNQLRRIRESNYIELRRMLKWKKMLQIHLHHFFFSWGNRGHSVTMQVSVVTGKEYQLAELQVLPFNSCLQEDTISKS